MYVGRTERPGLHIKMIGNVTEIISWVAWSMHRIFPYIIFSVLTKKTHNIFQIQISLQQENLIVSFSNKKKL